MLYLRNYWTNVNKTIIFIFLTYFVKTDDYFTSGTEYVEHSAYNIRIGQTVKYIFEMQKLC